MSTVDPGIIVKCAVERATEDYFDALDQIAGDHRIDAEAIVRVVRKVGAGSDEYADYIQDNWDPEYIA